MSVSNEALIGEAAHLLQDQIVVDMVMHASTSLWSEPRDIGYDNHTKFTKKRHICNLHASLSFRSREPSGTPIISLTWRQI